MANESMDIALKKDWSVANPWAWLAGGFALTLWSWLWTLTFGEWASDYRVIVLALGLLLTGAGLWLRWRDQQTLYWGAAYPNLAAFAAFLLGGVFGLLALGITGFFLSTFFYSAEHGWHPGATFLVAISTVPTFFWASRRMLVRDPQQRALDADEEIALSFLVAAAVCILGSFTLSIPKDPTDWDTFRFFLRVLGSVALFGAALVVVSQRVRRLAMSLLFVLHFCAITTACLAAPPSPWIVQQTWVRLFRPYLEFMYLNNAYHFYAPDPGPSSYLWFRVIYMTPERQEFGLWYKVPELDENGRVEHSVSLEYQRFLAMTESVAPYESLPPDQVFNAATKQWEWNPFWKNRLELQPNPAEGVIVGKEKTKQLRIPLRPGMQPAQQVYRPGDGSRRLFASYARFVARKFAHHPEHPDWEVKSVKVYRVVHFLPPVQFFQNDIPPTDPELYHPFYVGNYSKKGELLEDGDPYRFWLVPIVRDNPNDPDSDIRDYARLHAGDPKWIRKRDPITDKVVWTDK